MYQKNTCIFSIKVVTMRLVVCFFPNCIDVCHRALMETLFSTLQESRDQHPDVSAGEIHEEDNRK